MFKLIYSTKHVYTTKRKFFFQNRNIGLGFGKKSCPLTRMPGWEKDSIGYHGDDG